ncbi:MAG: hypothetical protein P4L80_13325 [Xanthobacteraceae bacterium]|nr:hypothetical protein [Xanthobacteraceae bacterium]
MLKYVSLFAGGFLLSLAFLSFASAAPVSSGDLSGKTICWDNGSTSRYGGGGKYSNNLSGEGTWAITGGGVHIHTDRYDYVAAIQKLPDGTFQAVVIGAGIKSAGKYCK